MSNWFCTSNTRNIVVKIVHPGGRIELHERPMLAEEIMLRNTRCFVTHPHVFSDPWAVVAPDEVLMLGQKFYVVPISTIKKLQRHHLRRSPSSLRRGVFVLAKAQDLLCGVFILTKFLSITNSLRVKSEEGMEWTLCAGSRDPTRSK